MRVKGETIAKKTEKRKLREAACVLVIVLLVPFFWGCTSKAEKAWESAQENIDAKEYETAIDELSTVIREADTSDAQETEHMILAYYLRGDCYKQLGEDEKSESDYEKAVEEDTKERDFTIEVTATRYLRRGLLAMKEEDYQGALDDFAAGLSCSEISCEKELRYNRIICYEKLGDMDAARGELEVYTQKYPDDTDMVKEYKFLMTR